MNTRVVQLVALGFILFITSCSSKPEKPDFTEQSSGFLENYDLLKPVKSPEGLHIYAYTNPNKKQSDYDAAIVEPVFVYEGATADSNITHQTIENARRGINAGIKRLVSEHFELTDKPAPGVYQLDVAITGATLEKEGFKPWNIIPVSAAITLASHATGLESKKPILVVELKFTDSQTGELLKEVLTTISGENFRKESNTSAEFEVLAHDWVAKVLEYARTH